MARKVGVITGISREFDHPTEAGIVVLVLATGARLYRETHEEPLGTAWTQIGSTWTTLHEAVDARG